MFAKLKEDYDRCINQESLKATIEAGGCPTRPAFFPLQDEIIPLQPRSISWIPSSLLVPLITPRRAAWMGQEEIF